jgi:phenylalanyl-tRNA synthetase beta chain
MVIADDEKALAIAGIMGGLSSSVTDETKISSLSLHSLHH